MGFLNKVHAVNSLTKMYFSSNKPLSLTKKSITDDFNTLGTWFTTNREYSSWHGNRTWAFEIPDIDFKLFNGEHPQNEWWLYFLDNEVYKKVFRVKSVPDFSRKSSFAYSKYLHNKKYLKAFQENLKAKGYKGIHITPKVEWDGQKDTHVFVVFDPSKDLRYSKNQLLEGG